MLLNVARNAGFNSFKSSLFSINAEVETFYGITFKLKSLFSNIFLPPDMKFDSNYEFVFNLLLYFLTLKEI